MSANFSPCRPLLWDCCFESFKNSQTIYAGYVNVSTRKSKTGRVKLNISASAEEVKFSLGKGKNPPGWGSLFLTTQAQLYNGVTYEL